MLMIVNPAAGNRRCGKAWPIMARKLEAAGLHFAVEQTERPGDAIRIARDGLLAGAETIVAVGGDGTANEVINGFFVNGRLINPVARFGLIQIGTGSDLGRTLGLIGERAYTALGPLGRTGKIDLIRVRFKGTDGQPLERLCVNVADLGLGGETAAIVSEGSKVLGGFLAFLLGSIQAIIRHRPKAVQYAIDNELLETATINIIFVANCRYLAGGMFVAPSATPTDGQFDVIILQKVSKLDLLLRLLPAIYRGVHLEHPAVQYRRGRCLNVMTEDKLLIEIDGEQLGTAPASFEIVPAILPIALPPE